jgi:hypothetical protein
MSIPVVTSRRQGQIVFNFDRKGPVPTLPYELHEHITADAWASRIPQLIRLSNRYNRPALEGLWFVVMFIATLAVPAGLHATIEQSLRKDMSRVDAFYEARFICFGIAIAILMLFIGPHMVWKFMGQKRATELVKRWEAEDARVHPPGSFLPVWSVRLAGYLSTHTVLTITTPYTAAPSYFHPAAYMPSWINGPSDTGPPNGVPPTYQGFQQPGMYGEVPLYGVHGGGPGQPLPPYVGDNMRPYSDEKAGFESTRA